MISISQVLLLHDGIIVNHFDIIKKFVRQFLRDFIMYSNDQKTA
jgi:hypothetical protein